MVAVKPSRRGKYLAAPLPVDFANRRNAGWRWCRMFIRLTLLLQQQFVIDLLVVPAPGFAVRVLSDSVSSQVVFDDGDRVVLG